MTADEVYWLDPDTIRDEFEAWGHWFRQHGVKLSEKDGCGPVLVWKNGQRGYLRREIERRRIVWINGRTLEQEFFQLESPPLPFPEEIR